MSKLSDSNLMGFKVDHRCRTCQSSNLNRLIEFGPQPRCFDFLTNNVNNPELFDFSLGQCSKCGVIQLIDPIPAKKLHPKFDWIRNKEPDQHIDLLAKDLLRYLKINNMRVLFLSIYDKKIYDKIHEHLSERPYMLDPLKDLGVEKTNPGQALIQEQITSEKTKKLSEKIGQFDLIVTCRLLEHTHNTYGFVSALTQLLKPNGRLVIEVPDSTKSLSQGDITMLWEEHTNYFTPDSLKYALGAFGFQLEKCIVYPYPQEDALVAVFKVNIPTSLSFPISELHLGNIFKKKIEHLKSTIADVLEELKNIYGDIAIFGAGHRTVMLVNLLELSNHISYIIDDDDKKQNLRLPGCNLRVQASDAIKAMKIGVCLLSVNIKIEEKIKNVVNTKAGKEIQFFSVLPDSKNALPILNAHQFL